MKVYGETGRVYGYSAYGKNTVSWCPPTQPDTIWTEPDDDVTPQTPCEDDH